ncbi:carbon-nitrogen hydrolase [Backusella circina FSU 941]|nr:carbon-nitrogen hydrolase [Backusella circina FSU 941]
MRIAAVQLHIDHDDKQVNWTRVEEFTKKASEQGADLVVFPEYFLGGPTEDKVEESVDSALEQCCQIAKKYHIDLVPGTIMAREDGFVYNNCYYIDCSGEVLLSYRKVHLWHPERTLMKKGDQFNTCRNRFGIEVGLCVCWDIAFPEAFREMALKKEAQLIIAPAYWTLEDGGQVALNHDPLCEAKLLNAIGTARCVENSIVFVLCNGAYTGEVERRQPLGEMAGRTQISVPFKGPVAHLDHNREDMIIANVDIEGITRDSENIYRVREDWKNGLVFGQN